jgi:hypothetical protein
MKVAALHLTYLDEDLRPKCPACSSYRVKEQALRGAHGVGDQVHDCLACGAVFGTFAHFEDSYQHVAGRWCGCQIPKGAPDVEQRYFDFTGLNGQAQDRRHGWYHPACKRLTQVG